MTRSIARTHIAVAGLMTLLLIAFSAVPAAGAQVQRGHKAEHLAFRLANCIRTGGWVMKDGRCKDKGSGKHSKYVKPLHRSKRITNQVAWPWAKRSALVYGQRRCWIGHARNGSTVNKRFRSVGLKAKVNGESMGCGFYGGKATTIRLLRMWQAEKAYRGWHWRNLKDPDFKSAGVGVARLGPRKAMLIFDFYSRSSVS